MISCMYVTVCVYKHCSPLSYVCLYTCVCVCARACVFVHMWAVAGGMGRSICFFAGESADGTPCISYHRGSRGEKTPLLQENNPVFGLCCCATHCPPPHLLLSGCACVSGHVRRLRPAV
ncbi:unnamed protein product [Boreogadus saida]